MKNNDGTYISLDSLICEYCYRHKSEEDFVCDDKVKQIISEIAKIVIDRIIGFTELSIESGKKLVDAYDPCPEDVKHSGDPIGRKGPSFDQVGWVSLIVYDSIKCYLEDIKKRL